MGVVMYLLFAAAVGVVALQSADCPDYDLLMEFYKATGGPVGWFHRDSWGKSGNCCGVWRGIKCGSDNHVTHVDLAMNNLTSSVPKALFLLPSLQYVDIGYNQLTGALPPIPANTQLAYLGVYSNHLTGGVPLLPASMNTFDAHSNSLSGAFPSPLPAKISQLIMQDNDLSGELPAKLPDTLTMINVYGNHFHGPLPSVLPPQLLQLSVSANNFTGSLPTQLPASLTQLLAFDNQLTLIPATLTLPSQGLANCILGGNPFKCPVPNWALNKCGAKCN